MAGGWWLVAAGWSAVGGTYRPMMARTRPIGGVDVGYERGGLVASASLEPSGVDVGYERGGLVASASLEPSGFDEIVLKTSAIATVDQLIHHAHVVARQVAAAASTKPPAGKASKRSTDHSVTPRRGTSVSACRFVAVPGVTRSASPTPGSGSPGGIGCMVAAAAKVSTWGRPDGFPRHDRSLDPHAWAKYGVSYPVWFRMAGQIARHLSRRPRSGTGAHDPRAAPTMRHPRETSSRGERPKPDVIPGADEAGGRIARRTLFRCRSTTLRNGAQASIHQHEVVCWRQLASKRMK